MLRSPATGHSLPGVGDNGGRRGRDAARGDHTGCSEPVLHELTSLRPVLAPRTLDGVPPPPSTPSHRARHPCSLPLASHRHTDIPTYPHTPYTHTYTHTTHTLRLIWMLEARSMYVGSSARPYIIHIRLERRRKEEAELHSKPPLRFFKACVYGRAATGALPRADGAVGLPGGRSPH